MNLYVGGAGQGKTAYAQSIIFKQYKKKPLVFSGTEIRKLITADDPVSDPVLVVHLEEYIRQEVHLYNLGRKIGSPKSDHDADADHDLEKPDASEDIQDAIIQEPVQELAAIITEVMDWILDRYPDITIVCNEIGNGIVPVDAEERLWREVTGRILIGLAQKAQHFERVIAGMGQVIK